MIVNYLAKTHTLSPLRAIFRLVILIGENGVCGVLYSTIGPLTPKGLNVPKVTKLVLVNVVLPHTIFRFFETFCEDASSNKLRISANFMILGATAQKLRMFEVFGQGLAMAGMC